MYVLLAEIVQTTTKALLLKIVLQDDHLPMLVETNSEVDTVLDIVWVSEAEKKEIVQYAFVSLTGFLI
jgi:hypothetical protein